MMLEMLREFFVSAFPELEIVGSEGNGMLALKECLELQPDIVVADVQLPEVNGLEILHMLKTKLPEVKTLIFTGHTSNHTLEIAIHEHADAFVSKNAGLRELETAVQHIMEGKTYISPSALRGHS